MKVYIHTDIEGVAGWVFYGHQSNTIENQHHIQRMNQLLTHEVAAAAQGALDSGADEVWVNDSHACCYSIIFEQLPKQCQIIHGRPGYFDGWLGCFDASVDAMVCIGMHAGAGTAQAVCPHSLWHINADAQTLSEATMAAALAGYHQVPCVCVSGDDKVCAEVKSKVPNCEIVVVKWAIAAQNARSLIPAYACEKIYEGVKTGLAQRHEIAAYHIPGPYRVNISDRDPANLVLAEDVQGDDFWETVHRALNATDYGNFGVDETDDGSFRWPN